TSFKADTEQYTYGQDLESQIPEVIRMYLEDGHNTNQGFMAVGSRESIKLPDPPCLRGIDTRVMDGKLHFILYFRSWDLWAGFPSNLAGIQMLKEYVAGEIGVEDGELIALSKGLHLYDYTWDLARVSCGMNTA
ncbi:thymidylate synthase, partial [Chloroflexota bacterium]